MIVWLLGDSWTDPTTYPWAPSQGWPAIMCADLGLGLINSGTGGAGYVAAAVPSPGLPNLPQQAERGAGAGADVVLVWGSLNDYRQGATADQVRAAAATTFGLIARLCPDAVLIATGPQWGADPPPAALLAHRDAVAAAAHDVGAVFVDVTRWLAWQYAHMINVDHPDPWGHALIASRLGVEVGHQLPR